MKKVLLLLGLCCGGYILSACGGGQGQPGAARASHGSGKVILKITVPSRFAAQTGSKLSVPSDRLIPSESTNLHITYSAIDTSTGLLLTPGSATPPTTQNDGLLDVSVTPGVITVTLDNFAAAINNTVTVLAQEGLGGPTLASGSTAMNITPGSVASGPTESESLTLTSTVAGGTASISPSNPTLTAASTVTLTASFTNSTGTAVVIAASNLSWSISPAGFARGVTNANGTFTVSELQPRATPVTVTVVYAEQNTTIQTATTMVTLSPPKFVPPATSVEYLESDGVTNVPAANLFDVSYASGSLFYDPTLIISGISTGYSRVAPAASTFPPANDVVDFDSAFPPGPTFCGPTSRMAFLPGATSAADQWVITGLTGTQVSSFTRGYQSRNVGGAWEYPPTPFNPGTLIDVDAKGSLVYLLEKVGAAYKIETLNSSGASQGIITIPAIADAPQNMAVSQLLNSTGALTETDFYLAGATHIAKFKVPVSGTATLNPDFTVSVQTAINPVDIATSTNSAYLFELDSAGKINLFYAVDGTVAPISSPLASGSSLIPTSGTVAGSRLSTVVSGANILLFVTDQNSELTQIETYTIQ